MKFITCVLINNNSYLTLSFISITPFDMCTMKFNRFTYEREGSLLDLLGWGQGYT